MERGDNLLTGQNIYHVLSSNDFHLKRYLLKVQRQSRQVSNLALWQKSRMDRENTCYRVTDHEIIGIEIQNIPILPMAFLTFAEAKVVAPPKLPMNKLVTFPNLPGMVALRFRSRTRSRFRRT